ncbi:NAD-dependent epimerase/dehydratase family protein [Candidatus Pelagibacter sp.]|jgi:UDP-glucose 4-epimerase|nr:NAD-dependent epimerase/dehydratase family protein [Candidatus Pelagibacter sp.]
MKDIVIVTGGAGFVGTNLILLLLKKTKLKIISIDNYSSGKKINHIKNKRLKYIKGHTKNIASILETKKKKIKTIFHFGEFSRIYQSFLNMNECIDSNSVGSNAVFNFCLKNKIKLMYSATSATFGNKGEDKNLSPYAFTKSKNLEMLENLKKWFKMKYEVIYFYNVYGPGQIKEGPMATVIGIFENYYKKNKPLPVVKPGTQSRRFTHITDTVNICYLAWKKDLCRHYIITNKISYTIKQVAKLFGTKSILLPTRKGERYASALSSFSQSNKIFRYFGNIQLRDYIKNFIKEHNNKGKLNS